MPPQTTTYNILHGVTIPKHVYSSNKYRNLRVALDGAEVNTDVPVHVPIPEGADDKDAARLVDLTRQAGYNWATRVELGKKGLRMTTRSCKLSDCDDSTRAQLNEQGVVSPNDRIIAFTKVRVQ